MTERQPAGNANPIHREYHILLLDHDDTIAQQPNLASVRLWGNDYIAGGAGEDEIFGELGDGRDPGRWKDRNRPAHRGAHHLCGQCRHTDGVWCAKAGSAIERL